MIDTDPDVFQQDLRDLEPYTEYSVTVWAETQAGMGEHAIEHRVTQPACKFRSHSSFLVVSMLSDNYDYEGIIGIASDRFEVQICRHRDHLNVISFKALKVLFKAHGTYCLQNGLSLMRGIFYYGCNLGCNLYRGNPPSNHPLEF